MKKNNPYNYIGFVVIVLLLAKLIFTTTAISTLASATKPIIAVLIIIYLINPLVNLLETKTKLKRASSVFLAFFICFFGIASFIGLILPSIIESSRMIIKSIPSNNEQFLVLADKIPVVSYFIDTTSLSNFLDAIGQWVVSFSENIVSYSDTIISSVKGVITAFSLGILSILMAFYALRDNTTIHSSLSDALNTFLPERLSTSFLKVLQLMDVAFKKFLIGKLYTCLFLGIIVTVMILIFNLIGPWGIHIPYAPLIGFIIGLTNIIPYVGPLIGSIPCLFLALLSGFGEVILLLIIILVSQQIDNIIISPKIIGNTVGMNPFWIVFSVVVGGILFGAIGMVLFVPLTSVFLKLANERIALYKKEKATTQ